MRSPREAIAEILERIAPHQERADAPLDAAVRRVLAAPVLSDVDLPPFEKSMMDGYAVRSSALEGASSDAPVRLARAGESRAGEPYAGGPLADRACVEIYTGAELPADCDAVVMIEHVTREGEDVAFSAPVSPGQNVSHRGEVLGHGRPVFAAGRLLRGVDLPVLAAVGCDPVPVYRAPRVTVLTTGDELVPVGATPGPGQIREGNTVYLAERVRELGGELREVAIVPDDRAELEARFDAALEEGDALVTTGGVSMGRYDLVGPALEAIGVELVLHKVAVKPGKPIWFGMRGSKPVFGLPGNPVSSMLGFELFVRPSLLKLAGAVGEVLDERLRRGRWTGGPTRPNERQVNMPCRIVQADDGVDELVPLAYKGSADIVGLCDAEAFCVVEPGDVLAPGAAVQYRPLGA